MADVRLGRKPRPFDARDYKMADYLRRGTLLDSLLAKVLASHLVPKVIKAFCKELVAVIEGTNPTPPPAPSGAVVWELKTVLDQGQTPHCVGFGWADWGNCAPVEDSLTNHDGDVIYYACKVIDGEPGAEDGSNVSSGAKVMKNRGKLQTYVFAETLDDIKSWILTKGPVVVGTDWTDDMFNPTADGFVKPTGSVAGGHCYLMIGYDPDKDVFQFQNSWGPSWSLNGRFFMLGSDFAQLFSNQGDACAAAEVLSV